MHRLLTTAALRAAVLIGMMSNAAWAGWAESPFVESAHDFGPVPRGGKVRHEFALTNRLNEPITIVNVRASCGCTSGRATASVIAPGRSAAIEAEMDTRNFVGPKATTLFVAIATASGSEAEVRLGVSSTILSDVVLNPGTVEFGTVAHGQTPTQVLTIDRVGLPTWKVQRMVSASRVIKASLTETSRTESSVSYTLTVSLKADAPSGTIRDEIRLLSNDPETASIPILVTAQIRGDLTAKPSVLSMGTVASAGGAQGRFLVMASKPFAIQSVEGAGDGFHVGTIDPKPKTVHVLSVSYRPEEGTTRGDLRHVFRIRTDLPREAPLEVSVTLHVDP